MELGNGGGATEHADADPAQQTPTGAADHAMAHVLLQQADLPNLQRANRRVMETLRDEARRMLNWLTEQEDENEPYDLTGANWQN